MSTEILSVELERLLDCPIRVNRMAKRKFIRLRRNIELTGNYEPIVVREHPKQAGCYEIINGHYRVAALRQLGYKEADCVVWDVDDAEILVLLGTFNGLRGRDSVDRKAWLVRELSHRYEIADLVRRMGETHKSIERLRTFGKVPPKASAKEKAFLNPVVFFVDDGEKRLLDKAIDKAVDKAWEGTRAEKRRRALVRICGGDFRFEKEKRV